MHLDVPRVTYVTGREKFIRKGPFKTLAGPTFLNTENHRALTLLENEITGAYFFSTKITGFILYFKRKTRGTQFFDGSFDRTEPFLIQNLLIFPTFKNYSFSQQDFGNLPVNSWDMTW